MSKKRDAMEQAHHDACEHDDACCCDHDHCGCPDDDCCCEDEHGPCDCGCEHDHAPQTRELSEKPTLTYHVLGIDCPSCATNTQNAVRVLECVKDARIVYATATLEVVLDPTADSFEARREILSTVRSCGQDLELSDEEREELSAKRSWYREHREYVLMCLSGVLLLIGLVVDHLVKDEAGAIPFYVGAALAGLVYIMPMAIASLRRRTADMNVLMALAVIGALIMGFLGDSSVFGDAAIVIFLDEIGEWLEGWSMRKTTGSIKNLMNLAPDLAHVIESDDVRDVEVAELEEGVRIRVLPGERVPLDGVILSGSSSFNEAAITGESTPKDKGEGDEVFAGALNTSGVVELEVTACSDETMLSRIVGMVQGAQAEKAPYENFVDRFAAVYTPIVVGCALVLGIAVPLLLSLFTGFDGKTWHDWVYRALSLLVVACPCALVISTPVSFVSAITRAANNGVLVKGGAYFDIANKVTAMAFDKTGTLTTGNPSVVALRPFAGVSEHELLATACALESSSTHPLARAVVAGAAEREMDDLEASDIQEIAANGVQGSIEGQVCTIGKLLFAQEQGELSEAEQETVSQVAEMGATALVVMRGSQALGVVGVADTVRPEAAEAMAGLNGISHVQSLEMLTGDNGQAAEAIAKPIGMTHVVSDLLPDGKVQYVRDMQAHGEVVAMVGDGINDAPALATADLAVTMGAAASDTALEVADVALLSDDLLQLPKFLRLSERTMHVVCENICLAIFVKAVVFVLVVLGVAGMGAAVFADTGVALIVILNGMRLMTKWDTHW